MSIVSKLLNFTFKNKQNEKTISEPIITQEEMDEIKVHIQQVLKTSRLDLILNIIENDVPIPDSIVDEIIYQCIVFITETSEENNIDPLFNAKWDAVNSILNKDFYQKALLKYSMPAIARNQYPISNVAHKNTILKNISTKLMGDSQNVRGFPFKMKSLDVLNQKERATFDILMSQYHIIFNSQLPNEKHLTPFANQFIFYYFISRYPQYMGHDFFFDDFRSFFFIDNATNEVFKAKYGNIQGLNFASNLMHVVKAGKSMESATLSLISRFGRRKELTIYDIVKNSKISNESKDELLRHAESIQMLHSYNLSKEEQAALQEVEKSLYFIIDNLEQLEGMIENPQDLAPVFKRFSSKVEALLNQISTQRVEDFALKTKKA